MGWSDFLCPWSPRSSKFMVHVQDTFWVDKHCTSMWLIAGLCLHDSLLNTTNRQSWCATGQNTLFWAQWRHVTAASGPCSWENYCVLTDYTFLKWPISVHFCHPIFVIKWRFLNLEITLFPSNMKFHLYFKDSLHYNLERDIFRNAPQSTPWIYRGVMCTQGWQVFQFHGEFGEQLVFGGGGVWASRHDF
jgi:hypothetical protein